MVSEARAEVVQVAPVADTSQLFQKIRIPDPINVIVLVPGTTRPVNTGETRASSDVAQLREWGSAREWAEPSQPLTQEELDNWYWSADHHFRRALVELKESYNNLHLFTAHAWTGKNSSDNRRIAGSYLADRLCGGGRDPAYYQGWKSQVVHFHLIGHSHGGNVINEFLRRGAELRTRGPWPATWTVRSITYLSTPFFQTQHKPELAILHPDCAIANVFNRYDLTQRVVADFTMAELQSTLDAVRRVFPPREFPAPEKKKSFLPKTRAAIGRSMVPRGLNFNFIFLFLSPWGSLPTGSTASRESLAQTASRESLAQEELLAREAYDELIAFVEQCLEGLARCREALDLMTGRPSPVAGASEPSMSIEELLTGLKPRVSAPLTPGLSATDEAFLRRVLGTLTRHCEGYLGRLRRGLSRAGCTVDEFYRDASGWEVAEALGLLRAILEVDPQTLEGPLPHFIASVALGQVERFDDTRFRADDLFPGVSIENIDVSSGDSFYEEDHSPYQYSFEMLVDSLERLAATFHENPQDQAAAFDMVLWLVAQLQGVRSLLFGSLLNVPSGALLGLAERFFAMASVVSGERRAGGGVSRLSTNVWEELAGVLEAIEAWRVALRQRSVYKLERPNVPNQTSAVSAGAGSPSPAQDSHQEPAVVGSVMHFMLVSHSVSRRHLHAELRSFLTKHITTRQAARDV